MPATRSSPSRSLTASSARSVAAALRQGGPIDTVIGPLRFDEKGDAEGITSEIDVWKGGRYGPMD